MAQSSYDNVWQGNSNGIGIGVLLRHARPRRG
jgi:hypothetical protein